MNNTRIIRMSGKLEEQLYQYAFLRYIEICTNEKCLVDDSDLCIGDDAYQLERIFGVKLNLLSNYFSKDVWDEMMSKKAEGYSVPQQLLDNGLDIMLVTESDDYLFNGNMILFDPKFTGEGILKAYTNARGNVYYNGLFENPIYFFRCLETLRRELVFPKIKETLDIDTINRQYANLMYITNSVAIYIKGNSSFEKYVRIINRLRENGEQYTFFIFSDDIKWCKEHRRELSLKKASEEVIFVEENQDAASRYIDMHLMGWCKKMVVSDENFDKWAYYLHVRDDLELINVDEL